MRLRWLPTAVDDLEQIVAYLHQSSPEAAIRVAQEIYQGIVSLTHTPAAGRHLPDLGVRQLIFARRRYVATYRIDDDEVQVLRIVHASRASTYP